MSDDITNLIRREVARHLTRFARTRHLLVTSYDPKTNSVKGTFQPEGHMSGWIPINTHGASGSGISEQVGPSVGDLALVSHAEGDPEAAHVTGFLHNDIDQPPGAPSGTGILKHNPSGNLRKLDAKGFRVETPGGAHSVVADENSQHRVQIDGYVSSYVFGTDKFKIFDSQTKQWWTINPSALIPTTPPPDDPTAS